MATIPLMMKIEKTKKFMTWFDGLKDQMAQKRILARMERAAFGNPGDHKVVGEGVMEMRIDHGPGYRLYYVQRGNSLIIMLAGGTKSHQQRDIEEAMRIARGI